MKSVQVLVQYFHILNIMVSEKKNSEATRIVLLSLSVTRYIIF